MISDAGNSGFGGAGDPVGYLSMGAGDPTGFLALRTYVYVVGSEFLWYPGHENDRTRQASPLMYPQQGGPLIDLVSTGAPWPAGDYNIQLVSVLGAEYPNLTDGASAAIEGRRSRVSPIFGNTVLRFAMPRVPIGVFDIRVRHDGMTMDIQQAIRSVPGETSLEANRFRSFFNIEVYSKRGPMT